MHPERIEAWRLGLGAASRGAPPRQERATVTALNAAKWGGCGPRADARGRRLPQVGMRVMMELWTSNCS